MTSCIKGCHGQSELCVLNEPKEAKVLGPLANGNKESLVKRAKEITEILLQGGKNQEEQGFFSSFFSSNVDKGATQIGAYVGTAAGQAYGSGAINKALEIAGRKVMGPMNERVFNLAIGATQMAVTPKVLPFLTAFSTAVGGIAFPVAVTLVGMLYNRLLSSDNYTLETLPPPDQLIRYDSEQKCFYDALGEEFGEQELKDYQVLIQEYDLICKILASNKDDVPGVIMDALNFNSPEFKDLDLPARKNLEKEITETTKRLQENNRFKGADGILPCIANLVKTFNPPVTNLQRVEEDQNIHSLLSSLDSILAKISAPTEKEQELFFDEETKSLYVPTNLISRLWNRQSKVTAEKVSNVMKAALLAQCNKIDEAAENLKTVSREELDEFREKIFNLTKSFDTLYAVAQNSSEKELMSDAVTNMFTEAKIRLDAVEEKLRLKMN
jgi:hypothetical protein